MDHINIVMTKDLAPDHVTVMMTAPDTAPDHLVGTFEPFSKCSVFYDPTSSPYHHHHAILHHHHHLTNDNTIASSQSFFTP